MIVVDDGFAIRLRDLRKKKGMTQTELCKRVGVGKTVISNYEAGKRKNIATPIINSIANELGVSQEELIGNAVVKNENLYPRASKTWPDPNAPMEYFCAGCRQKFVAHKAVRSITCPLCGVEHLVMWHICPDCLQRAKADVIPRRPYKCPVCNGHGSESGCTALCHACKGTGIVWDGGEH